MVDLQEILQEGVALEENIQCEQKDLERKEHTKAEGWNQACHSVLIGR